VGSDFPSRCAVDAGAKGGSFYYTRKSAGTIPALSRKVGVIWSAPRNSSREAGGHLTANSIRTALANSGLSFSPRKRLHPAFFKGVRTTWLPPKHRAWYLRGTLDLKSVVSSSRFNS
jgi:hypothetical protein